MTNRQIGTKLFISERTAQNHVQHPHPARLHQRSQIAVWHTMAMSIRNEYPQ